ncbi:MAG: hypothetical protein IPI31_12515 [Bacteroidetes bacterium]|nr:hypothetical protein [Bacteroidota bacterium]
MKNSILFLLIIFGLTSCNTTNGVPNSKVASKKNESSSTNLNNENYLKDGHDESIEFTKNGNYRFVIMSVGTPGDKYINFCMEDGATTKFFWEDKNVHNQVKTTGRCIQGLQQNLVGDEFIVDGVLPGDRFQAWPTQSGVVLRNTGLWGGNCSWTSTDGQFRIDVIVTPK